MSWKLIDRPKTLRVSKSLAREFANMDSVPNDRPLSERRLNVYRKMFADGGFRPVTWAKVTCKETMTTYRVNGKHTSILLSSMDTLPEFYVTIESYEAGTLADVAQLYSTFDSQTQSRTSRDIYMSFAGTVPELAEIPGIVINAMIPGIAYAKTQEKSYYLTPSERAEMILDHVDFAQWANGIVRPPDGKNARTLSRLPVLAAMVLTYERDQKDATTFWTAVRDETGATPSDPDRKLARWLLTTNINARGGNVPLSKKADNREFFVRCLKSWNSWRKDQPDTFYYRTNVEIPAVI